MKGASKQAMRCFFSPATNSIKTNADVIKPKTFQGSSSPVNLRLFSFFPKHHTLAMEVLKSYTCSLTDRSSIFSTNDSRFYLNPYLEPLYASLGFSY